jgi:hypothetical protein
MKSGKSPDLRFGVTTSRKQNGQTHTGFNFYMKNLFFCFWLLVSFSLKAAISIVSDLDDTIKITQSSGEISDYVGNRVFTGIPEFFKATKDYSEELHILSASPNFLRNKIESVLKKRGMAYQGLLLRANLTEGKFSYKLKALKNILDNSRDDFILIGDDLGQDPEVYKAIKRLYPSRIVAIYIHAINGRPLVSGVTPYWTSFDLFLREYAEGRMRAGWIEFMLQKFMTSKNWHLIFPKKANCPTSSAVWGWQLATVFQPEAYELSKRFIDFCVHSPVKVSTPFFSLLE